MAEVMVKRAMGMDKKEHVYVTAPFHPGMPPLARSLGGIWTGKSWAFDARDEADVRAMCRKVYGTDGTEEVVDLCDFTIKLTGRGGEETSVLSSSNEVWLCGKQLCRRRSRDADVRLGEGVIIKEGRFPGSAGSARYPSLFNSYADVEVVLLVRDVPRVLAQERMKAYPTYMKILGEEDGQASLEEVGHPTGDSDTAHP